MARRSFRAQLALRRRSNRRVQLIQKSQLEEMEGTTAGGEVGKDQENGAAHRDTGPEQPDGAVAPDLPARQGKRLGDTRGKFLETYCRQVGNPQWSQYEVRPDRVDLLQERVADLVLRMDAEDYLELPQRIDSDVVVSMPPKAQKAYKQMQDDFLIELDQGEVLAANAAVKINKLLQVILWVALHR